MALDTETAGRLPAREAPLTTGPTGRARWLSLGGFSVLDQGLYAGSGFAVSVMLARWLSPESFGAFTLAFSVLALLVTLQGAAVTEPLGIFGAAKYAGRFRSYLRFVFAVQIALSLAAGVVVGLAGVVLDLSGQTTLAHALYGLAAAAPCVLLLWLARRAFYARFSPQWAALGGVAYAVLAIPAIVALHAAGSLTPASALLTAGAASLVVAAGLVALLRTRLPADAGGEWSQRRAVADHVRYARWALAASLTIWISAYVQYFVLTWGSFREVGAMRALDTVLLPWHQYLAAMSSVLLPAFALRLRDSGRDSRTFVVRTTAVFLAQAGLVCIVLAVAGDEVMSLLFGAKYAGVRHLLPVYALMIVPETIAAVLICVWRSGVRTRLVFVYNLVFTVTLVVAVAIAAHWGVSGVVVARLAVSFAVLAVFLALGRRSLLEAGDL